MRRPRASLRPSACWHCCWYSSPSLSARGRVRRGRSPRPEGRPMFRWITQHSRRIAALAIGTAALALVACTPEVNVATPGNAESTGIAVTGTGTTSVKPDLALVNLGIEATATTVAEARSKGATAMDALTKAVKAKGLADADIQTQSFNIFPQYGTSVTPLPNSRPTPPVIIGYTVSNTVQLRVRNLDALSDVIDAAIAAGGNAIRVNSFQFTIEKPDQYLAKAREEAVLNAKARAEILAKAAGVKVGPARSITESGASLGALDKAVAAPAPLAADGRVSTPVSPGQENLAVVVSVVFEITK
ncbi:MAG: DUF541 domain-containing protein [Dehalococcoidia bacterium]|nr:MAG: DUF541 domain-containing protein [Dehalococcoidia bacterium]